MKSNRRTVPSKPGPRPFVFLNAAISADGKLAPATRQYRPFGSVRDEALLYDLRASADAIMCGARTLDLQPATLGAGGERYRRLRQRRGLARESLRIVVSGSGSIAPGAEIFKHRFSPIIVLTTGRASERRLKALTQLADHVEICGERAIDFEAALRWLRARWGVRRLLCEGGGELNGSLLRAGLVDEVYVTVCPILIGGRGAPTLADGEGSPPLNEAIPLRLVTSRQVGMERFFRFKVLKPHPTRESARERGPAPVPGARLRCCREQGPGPASRSR